MSVPWSFEIRPIQKGPERSGNAPAASESADIGPYFPAASRTASAATSSFAAKLPVSITNAWFPKADGNGVPDRRLPRLAGGRLQACLGRLIGWRDDGKYLRLDELSTSIALWVRCCLCSPLVETCNILHLLIMRPLPRATGLVA